MAVGDLIPWPGGGDGGGGGGGGGGNIVPSWEDISGIPDFLTDNDKVQVLRDFASNPESYVLGIIFTAIVGGVLDIAQTMIDAVRYLWWGSPTTAGIVDLPRLILNPLITPFETMGQNTVTEITEFHDQLLLAVPDLWLLGPFVGTLLVTVEVLVVGWIVWQLLRIVDVPGVNLGPLLSAAATPFRALLRVIR
jgi:hypothetical protein